MGRPRKPRYTPPPGAAAALATFTAWLIEAEAWLLAHRDMLGFFPAPLYPSRMAAEARAWALGKKGRSPDQLTSLWVACQARALQRQLRAPATVPSIEGNGLILTLRFGAAVANHDRTAVYAPHP